MTTWGEGVRAVITLWVMMVAVVGGFGEGVGPGDGLGDGAGGEGVRAGVGAAGIGVCFGGEGRACAGAGGVGGVG
jgi:hypothetical protein